MKYRILLIAMLVGTYTLTAQVKQENEHRILKSNFPNEGLDILKENMIQTKRIKYYKEIDSAETRFTVKFKKDRLWYAIAFNEIGELNNVSLRIKVIDIPNESYDNIIAYLDKNFTKYKVKKMHQQYINNGSIDKTLKDAFQNLMTPSLNYEIEVAAKKEKEELVILFNADGVFKKSAKLLPKNYDHVLY